MILSVYDTLWRLQTVIDVYTSLIWTDRYFYCGDFELVIPANIDLLPKMQPNFYIMRPDSSEAMVIEKIAITTDREKGDTFKFSGRSLLSILDRRITWNIGVEYINEDPSAVIVNLVHDNITPDSTNQTFSNYSPAQRYIHGFNIQNTVTDTETMSCQSFGENLLDKVSEIAKTYGYGLKVTADPTAVAPLTFFVYSKSDRDIVADISEQIIASTYTNDTTAYKNMAMVGGYGKGTDRWLRTSYLDTTEPTDLSRRELYVDASDKNQLDQNAQTYPEVMKATGRQSLTNCNHSRVFEATTDRDLGLDLGDVVTADNGYGVNVKARVTEIIESDSEEGRKIVTSFSAWERS